MIIIHEGVPGSGKSYDAVRKIIDALKSGRVVYTNIDGLQSPDCLEYIAQKLGSTRDALESQLVFLPNSVIPSFWDHVEPGGFIVIDEAQLYFNSRDYNKSENRDFGSWASTHRHHGFDVLLITQRAERIDTAIRSLAEFRYRYRKLNVFGSLVQKGYLIYTFAGEDPKHLALRKATYDVSIFNCYQSYVGDATEKKVIKLPNILNHPIFYGLAAVIAFTVYFGASSPLLHGRLIDTPKLDALKASLHQKKDIKSLPLQKVQPAPAEGKPVETSQDVEFIVSENEIMLPLDGLIILKDRVLMTSAGYRLSKVVRYDRDMMVAWVLPQYLPPGLRVAVN